MKNWKIGTRISAGFAIIILIAATLGLFAYIKLGNIDTHAMQATTEDVPKLYLVRQIEKNVQALFALGPQHAATSDKQDKVEIESQIQAVRATNVELLTAYEKNGSYRERACADRGVQSRARGVLGVAG